MQQRPIVNESEIGKRIKALRNEKRITLESLAVQTGFTKGYLSKVEKSEKAPPVSTIGKIAQALGTTISALLGEAGSSQPICLVKKNEDRSWPRMERVLTIPTKLLPINLRTR